MTAFSPRRLPGHPAVAIAVWAATAAWAAVLIAAASGHPLVIVDLRVLAAGVPVAMGIAALLSDPPLSRTLGAAALAAGLVGASVLAADYIDQQPLYALGLPFGVAAAYCCARRPAAAVIVAFAFTGAFNTLEVFTPIPVGESIDLILAGLWGATVWRYMTTRRDRPVWLWPGVVITVIYLALTLLEVLGRDEWNAALYSFRVSAWYLAAFVLVGYFDWTPRQLRMISHSVAVAALAVGGYAVFRWVFGQSGQEVEAGVAAAGTYNTVNEEERLIGSFPTGHHLGAWMAIVTPMCLALALTWKDRWRWVAGAAAVLCTLALLASEVRSALLATVVAVALVIALHQLSAGFKGPRLGVTSAAVALSVGLGVAAFSLAIVSDADQQRYENLLRPGKDPSVEARLTKWSQALVDINDHPLGRGLGSSGEAEKRYSRFVTLSSFQLDNSYLHVATQQGMGMLVLYVAALLTLLGGLIRRSVQSASRLRAGIAFGAAGSLLALGTLMITGLYIEGLPALAGWLIVGLGVAQFTTQDTPDPG